jgi:hypothetical protein
MKFNFTAAGQLEAADKSEAASVIANYFHALGDGESPASVGEGAVITLDPADDEPS